MTMLCATIIVFLSGACSHTNNETAPPPSAEVAASTVGPHFEQAPVDFDYRWQPPVHHPQTILDTIGNGCAFLDYNQDGCLDILLIGPKIALYQGDGKGNFKDVTAEVGLSVLSGHFLGCAVGDYDNDGYPDIYVTGYQTGLLLHNIGGKRFEDVTLNSGIPSQSWGTSAAFADVDGDGKLDLYVGNYVKFDSTSQYYCQTNGVRTGCPPGTYEGVPGRLYRNLGGGHFADVTAKWGLQSSPGKTLGVIFADFDHSGRQSLALANDEVPGCLYLNKGGSFVDIGASAGTSYSSAGQPHAGMGEDWGDYDADGLLDLAVMTFSTESKPIFHNMGNHFFNDESSQLGLTSVLSPYVAFGVKWIDTTNDGWLDLLMTNGHTTDNIADTGQGYTYREPSILLKNENGKHFARIMKPVLDTPVVGRGLAIGDYDNDGKVDALIVDGEGRPMLLHNSTQHSGHWLMLRLIGHKSNRDGYGAEITLETAKRKLVRHCHADGSYLSSSDPRVHFGLADETQIRRVTIHWPDGTTQTLENLSADKILTVEERPR